MHKIFSLLLTFSISLFTFAQSPETYTSSEIFQQIKKLNVLASVLYVAAHPDDENNALLPYFAKGKLYRTAYLSLTRGDGGQNLIGDEQGVELGLIRTEELLAARKIDGAEQYFSRAYEFGFSKSAAEALRIWDKEKILSDVVWVIRKYQPDVIIKRFPPDKRAGHGHHAASSILAQEAFTAAADPKMFPEQFKYGVKPWQAKRILWNTYNFGGNNTTSEDQLKINIGGYDPLIGESYGELGGEARTMHKSQGEGRPRRRGESYEYFTTTGGEPPKNNDLMDGIVTNWKRVPGGEAIEKMIDEILSSYNVAQPELSVPALVTLHQAIKALPEGNWRNKKLDEVQKIIEECSALFVEATSSQPQVVQGGSLSIHFVLDKREDVNASLKNIKVENFDSSFMIPLVTNQNIEIDKTLTIAADKKISQPYWLVYPLKGGTFDVRDQTLIGKAWNDPSFEASFAVNIDGEDFVIKRPVQYRYVDPVKGDTYEPIPVLPKVEINYTKDNYLSINSASVTVVSDVKFNSHSGQWTIHPPLSASKDNFHVEQKFSSDWILRTSADNGFMNVESIFTPKNKGVNISEEISASAIEGNEIYNRYTKVIAYNHIPTITYFPEARANLVSLDIKIIGKKIGYIIGAGDKIPEALEAMGYNITYLKDADITDSNLKQFDAIITGIRAYNLYEYLSDKNDVFMRYVKNGGNMIVQYMKSNQVGDKDVTVGPYPFKISSGVRITEEDAKVNFLLPGNPALNYPNKITEKDFEGWVQERSTYQVVQADSHYEMPLGMHDTDEEESKGSLAIAKYGEGNFVYASLVFFRQLPAGIPGAYRLMANLIALQKNK
jgi:LmbE family N-acetylglucosaminyl deacetylase